MPNSQTATMTIPTELDVAAWDKEYLSGKTIPSSSRKAPSKILTCFRDIASLDHGGDALDGGCGNGRNSVYLADFGWNVTSIDASRAAIDLCKNSANEADVTNKIVATNQVLDGEWSLAGESFDLFVGSYVLCHYANRNFVSNYFEQVKRVLRPTGLMFSSFFSVEDSYYQKIGKLVNATSKLYRDPNNQLCKKLYTEPELKSLINRYFEIRAFVTLRFEDVCLGERFERCIFGVVSEKR